MGSSEGVKSLIEVRESLLESLKELTLNVDVDAQLLSDRWRSCLFFKILSDRNHRPKAITEILSKVWSRDAQVSFSSLPNGAWMAKFESLADRNRVIGAAPWHIGGDLIVIDPGSYGVKPSDYLFEKAPFWVHLVDLPVEYSSEPVLRAIGNQLGEVVAVDAGCNREKYVNRIRVMLNIRRPLVKQIQISVGSSSCLEIKLAYEKLPRYCHFCGRLGHIQCDCPDLSALEKKISTITDEAAKKEISMLMVPRYDSTLNVSHKFWIDGSSPRKPSPSRGTVTTPAAVKKIGSVEDNGLISDNKMAKGEWTKVNSEIHISDGVVFVNPLTPAVKDTEESTAESPVAKHSECLLSVEESGSRKLNSPIVSRVGKKWKRLHKENVTGYGTEVDRMQNLKRPMDAQETAGEQSSKRGKSCSVGSVLISEVNMMAVGVNPLPEHQ